MISRARAVLTQERMAVRIFKFNKAVSVIRHCHKKISYGNNKRIRSEQREVAQV